MYIYGGIAQMVERLVRIQEVSGSIPLISRNAPLAYAWGAQIINNRE